MLKETSNGKENPEDTVFVKFAFLYKASSDVYDCTLGTNPQGFTSAIARAKWKVPFVPPIKEFTESMNFYFQTGVIAGTVSVNDGEEYEMYLFGEKGRNIAKFANVPGSKCVTILGSVPSNGLVIHASEMSFYNMFENAPVGFVVDPNGEMASLMKMGVNITSFAAENNPRSFKASFNAGRDYEMSGVMAEPIVNEVGYQGWSGSVQLAFVEFEVQNKKGYGLILFGEVQKATMPTFNVPASNMSLPKTVPLTVKFTDEVSQFGEVSGGKGSSLGKLTQLSKLEKFIVPKGIIVTTSAFKAFLTSEIHDAVKHLEDVAYGNESGDLKESCAKVASLVENTELPNEIRHSIIENLADIFGDEVNILKFAVRSSATGEDTASMSAAGQMDTFLGVQGLNDIFTAVTKCWASQFGYIAIEYKRRNGQVLNSPMAVVIQEMVACEVSGVLFTCDPLTSNPSKITITANYGLGESVVSGSAEPDTWVLQRKDDERPQLLTTAIGNKQHKIIMQDSGGTVTEDIGDDLRNESCLPVEAVENLGQVAINIEEFYRSARDIEWGILNDNLYIFQSRPVTNATAETDYEIKHEFDAPLRCENEYFTVANIGEVMPRPTSILGLDIVTKYFCIYFLREALKKGFGENIFKSKYFLTGLLSFYNRLMMTVVELISMEGFGSPYSNALMMGVFGRILDDPDLINYATERTSLLKVTKMPLKSRLKAYWYLFSFDFGYHEVKNKIYNHPLKFLKLKTAKETFTALINSCSDFDDAAHYHMQCSDGSQTWNMSILKTLIKAKGEIDNDIYSDFARLLAASSNVESANIPQVLQEVAVQIVKDISCEKFKSMSLEEALEWLQTTNMPSGDTFRQFLKRHGHRCIQESDVRSITWEMEPKSLVKLLQNLAGAGKEVAKNKNDIDNVLSELQVPLGFISKCYLRFVLPMCRRGIRGREAGKAITMKAFDHWRKGYRRLGKLMVSEGRLPDADLLYFFTLEEVKELLETRSPGLISKAIHRRKIFPTLEKYVFPEIMKGLPKPINDDDDSADAHEYIADLTMKGTPVSQGVTKGYARVAVSLEEAGHLKPGEILITLSTDIGWSPYFPIVSGVVTEIGGLISHGAVISREYGIPCIVGLQGATKKFRTGDYILLDGKKGILQRLPQPE
ncbi:hypothetical protein CDAR_552561 [Caerostris darwini]|uniref:Phosphoenolpyruvate synthase n=1 Tax=Caerostris darwini TaxID=1538125 RepID=A0AAV4SSW5_9ARAC|nr:hypothetical protein CDAR_552561 [Caerostris darwini]